MMLSPGAIVRACTLGALIAALLVIMEGPAPLVLDAAGYWELGAAVAEGDWLLHSHPIAYRTPGYAWLIGLCQWLTGRYALFAIVLIQVLMSAAMVPLVANIARRLVPEHVKDYAQCASAIAMALMVSRLFWTRAILGETLFVFAMLLHVLCFLVWREKCWHWRWGVLVGFSCALMILVRPVGQWLWLAHFAWAVPWVLDCWRYRRIAPSVLVAVTVALICLAPWYARNLSLFGRPFLTEFLGRNIWIVTFQDQAAAGLPLPDTSEANALVALAASSPSQPVNLIKTWEVSRLQTESGIPDDRADRNMRAVAFQAMEKAPLVWLERAVRRFVNFFRCVPDGYPTFSGFESFPESQFVWKGSSWGSDVVSSLCGAPNLLLGTVLAFLFAAANCILIASKTYRWAGVWLAVMICYFAGVTALLEIPDYRYRMVIEPFQAIVIGAAVSWFFGKRTRATTVVNS